MNDRNRWDEDRRWRMSGSDTDDDDYRSESSRSRYGARSSSQQWPEAQGQSGQQDYSGEFSRDYRPSDYAGRRAGGTGRTYAGQGRYGSSSSHYDEQDWRQDQPRYGGRPRYGGQPRYDERADYQTSQHRYAGSGYSHYGAGVSASTGDYFGGGDYGSGAHAWDRGSTQSGSGRYGSTYSASGLRGDTGSTSSYAGAYAPGRDYQGSGQSHQREMGGYGQERGFLERAGDEVMSWFGDEDAARRREMDHRGQGPSDYTRSDDRIREDANDRLTDDWRVDARKISVAVQDGELTLSGTVPSRDAKHRAEECVENISGVRHVQNNLRVDATASNSLTGSTWGTTGSAATTITGSAAQEASKTTGTAGAAPRGTTTGSTSA